MGSAGADSGTDATTGKAGSAGVRRAPNPGSCGRSAAESDSSSIGVSSSSSPPIFSETAGAILFLTLPLLELLELQLLLLLLLLLLSLIHISEPTRPY